MRLSCSTLCFSGSDYPELPLVLDRIRELGFSTVDLATFEGWQNVDPSSLVGDALERRAIRQALGASGLRVSSLNVGFSTRISDPDSTRFETIRGELDALLHLAEGVECPLLTVQPGPLFQGQEPGETLSLIRGRLEILAKRTQDVGLALSVEAHQGSLLEDPRVALGFVRQLSPALGLTYDPSHFVMQGVDLPTTQPLLEVTTHVHVRNAGPGKMQETMAGGVIDFPWLLGALEQTGYAGDVAIEYFNGFDADFTSTLELATLLRDRGVSDR